MKFLRVSVLALICSPFSFGASKEIIELQRDVALLQDKVDAMQRDMDTKLGQLAGMVQALQDNSTRTAGSMAALQNAVSNDVSQSLTPVTGLNSKVDSMNDDVHALRDALQELSARLERMDAKITDLKNQMQIIQNPPPAPGAGTEPGSQQGQGAAAPPAGMSADKTYTDAVRDLQTGNTDLAYQEFQQYLTYFPNTELAANAQYYIGEINYNRGNYNGAIQAFDAVLERYPQNPKTPDAHLMKGMALVKAGQRTKAIQEFRLLVQNFPHSEDARKAQQQLRTLGAATPPAASARRRPQ